MSDDFRPFAFYNIEGVEVDLELLIKEKLVSGAWHYTCNLFRRPSTEYIEPDDVEEDTWKVMSFTGAQSEDVINFHKGRKNVNQRFLVIADRQDIEAEGLLVVNLDFQGVSDTVRMKAHKVCYALPSLSIDNTDWQEDIKTSATVPKGLCKAFAMLVDPSPACRRNATQIVERIHQGVQSSHDETNGVLAEWEGIDTDILEDFIKYFDQWKVEKDWQVELFICVRQPTIKSGQVEIVSAKSRKSIQLPYEKAGELLVSLAIGSIDESELAGIWM